MLYKPFRKLVFPSFSSYDQCVLYLHTTELKSNLEDVYAKNLNRSNVALFYNFVLYKKKSSLETPKSRRRNDKECGTLKSYTMKTKSQVSNRCSLIRLTLVFIRFIIVFHCNACDPRWSMNKSLA